MACFDSFIFVKVKIRVKVEGFTVRETNTVDAVSVIGLGPRNARFHTLNPKITLFFSERFSHDPTDFHIYNFVLG